MRRINKQLLKASAADVSSSREKLRKTSEGLAIPSPLLRPRVKNEEFVSLPIYAHKDKTRKKYMPDDGF